MHLRITPPPGRGHSENLAKEISPSATANGDRDVDRFSDTDAAAVRGMILIGLGANEPSAVGLPQATLEAALAMLAAEGVAITAQSRWYRSAPVPPSDQPWFVNGVAAVTTRLDPAGLLALLHRIEAHFGRRRRLRDEARPIDIDLLAYDDVVSGEGRTPRLPHPRLHQRAFVLLPLRDVAPNWRHPEIGQSVAALIASLPPGQQAWPIEAP